MCASLNDYYKMDHKGRGYAVIINNYKFDNPDYFTLVGQKNDAKTYEEAFRIGQKNDAKTYEETFRILGFKENEIKRFENQTAYEMKEIMKKYSNEDYFDYDCFICVFLSHGYLSFNKEYIMGTDEGVKFEDLIYYFKKSKSLFEKPKIFFMDVCRGNLNEPMCSNVKIVHSDLLTFKGETSGVEISTRNTDFVSKVSEPISSSNSEPGFLTNTDFFFGWASVYGYEAKGSSKGSWYSSILCETLKKHSDKEDLLSIDIKVRSKLKSEYKIMTSDSNQTFRKKCVFISKNCQTLTDNTGRVYCLAVLPDHTLACGYWETSLIKIWNPITSKIINTFTGHNGPVMSLTVLSHDILASSSADRSIIFWNIIDGTCIKTLNEHTNYARCLLFLSNQDILISGSYDTTIKIWNTSSIRAVTKAIQTLNSHTGWVLSLVYLSDHRLASSSTDKMIKIWRLRNGSFIKNLIGHTNYVRCLVVIEENVLASCSYDKTIKIWDIVSGTVMKSLIDHSHYVLCLVLIDKNRLASGSADATIKIWDITNGNVLKTLNGHANFVNSLSVLDYNKLVSCSDDGKIKIWDLENL